MIDGHPHHLSYSEHLDIMMNKGHPTIRITQTTMTHHLNINGIGEPMNHIEEDRIGSMNTKDKALDMEGELVTTSTRDKKKRKKTQTKICQ